MRSLRWWPAILALGATAALAAPTRAQDPEDPDTAAAKKVEQARAVLAEMVGATDAQIHALGARLEILAGDDDPVLRVVAEGFASDRPAIVLTCARITLPYHGDPAKVAALVRAGGPEAPWAAGLLGRRGEEEGLAALRTIFDDATASQAARRAAARGILVRLSGDAPAAAYLRGEVEHGSPEVVREAALALAEAGDLASVRPVLRALAAEPTVEGATARAYLRLDPLRDQLARAYMDLSLLVQEVVGKVQEYYPHPTGPDGKTAVDLGYCRDAAARGMIGSLDPFSGYLTLEDYLQNEERMSGSYGGIGAYVQTRPYRGDAGPNPREVLTISAPIYRQANGEKAPAYAAGIRSGDQVVEALVPERPAPVNLIGKTIQDCVDLLKGTPGTSVTIWVARRGAPEPLKFTLTRAEIEIDTAPGDLLPGGLGYVRILRFDNKTGQTDLRRRVADLRQRGAKALVIDLRNNPGGSLDEVVSCVGWFVAPDTLVTTTRGRAKNWQDREYHSRERPLWPTGPVVILTNDESASGSELFSGALHDHGRATVLGLVTKEKPKGETYGKGSGQTFIPLPSSGAVAVGNRQLTNRFLRLTVFKYYLPKGGSVHKIGLIPDIAVTLPEPPEWKLEEEQRLDRAEVAADYVARLIGGGAPLPDLEALARFDDHRPEAYPGFAAWAAGIETRLDAQGLREMLREELRVRLADRRGREYLYDFQVDEQLQRAILEALGKLGVKAETIPEYRAFAQRRFVEAHPPDAGAGVPAPAAK